MRISTDHSAAVLSDFRNVSLFSSLLLSFFLSADASVLFRALSRPDSGPGLHQWYFDKVKSLVISVISLPLHHFSLLLLPVIYECNQNTISSCTLSTIHLTQFIGSFICVSNAETWSVFSLAFRENTAAVISRLLMLETNSLL